MYNVQGKKAKNILSCNKILILQNEVISFKHARKNSNSNLSFSRLNKHNNIEQNSS